MKKLWILILPLGVAANTKSQNTWGTRFRPVFICVPSIPGIQ